MIPLNEFKSILDDLDLSCSDEKIGGLCEFTNILGDTILDGFLADIQEEATMQTYAKIESRETKDMPR